MRLLRIMAFMMVFLLWGAPSYGQEYNPDSPAEPGAPVLKYHLTVAANPPEGGSVSGSGTYVSGASVTLWASPSSGYQFLYWTDADDNIVSTERNYSITKSDYTESYTAHFGFDPSSPGEPTWSETERYYRLTLVSAEGGSVSGGGRYQPGKTVNIYASAYSSYKFRCWVDEDGNVVSTTSNYSYTTQARNVTLTAYFDFDPASPSEPSVLPTSHYIRLKATEGGWINFASKRVKEGESVYVSASTNSGYRFLGWYSADTLYRSETSFDYIMGDHDVEFEARFQFDPSSPGEPMSPSSRLSLYLMSEVTYPGTRVVCPLFVNSSEAICDLTFNLLFPPEAMPDWSTLTLDAAAAGYTANVTETDEDGVYNLTLTGATLPAYNGPLFTVILNVPEEIECTSYQVKINQVSVSLPSGDTVTAMTRNGRVYVYELGDTNGDGQVDLLDYVNMNLFLLTDGAENETFINEVSDVNEDGNQDLLDAINILEILMNK